MNIIYREIFASLPSIDGRLEEMNQKERDKYVKKVYKNTRKLLAYGVLVPVKESHDNREEKLHGKLLSVRMKFKKDPAPHYVIIGEISLDNEYAKLYKEDKLPGVSVEIAERANLMAYTGKENSIVQDHIYGVALLGNSPPAMPQLEKVHVDTDDMPYAMMYRRIVKENVYGCKPEKRGYGMDVSKLMEIKEALMGAANAIAEMIPKDDGDAPIDPEMEEKPKDKAEDELEDEMVKDYDNKETPEGGKDKAIAELESKVAKLEEKAIEREYDRMVKMGFVVPEQKKTFFKLSKNEGLDEVRKIFRSKILDFPEGAVIETPESQKGKANDRLRNTLLSLNFSEEEIEQHFKRLATTTK